MLAIYKKELKSYFRNMTGYIFIALLLLIIGIIFTATNLKSGYPNFEYSLINDIVIISLLILFPILTMQSLAEERRSKTDQLLFSLPMSMKKIVLAKYLAMLTVFLIPTALLALYPLILTCFGAISLGTAYSTLAGFFLMGAVMIAIGLFMSSLTESQIIAAVRSFGALLLIYLMSSLATLVPATAFSSLLALAVLAILVGFLVYYMTRSSTAAFITSAVLLFGLAAAYWIDSSMFEGAFSRLMNSLSVIDRFRIFAGGVFDLSVVIYDLSLVALFVFFSMQTVEKRRWS